MKRFIVVIVLAVTVVSQAASIKHYSKLRYPPGPLGRGSADVRIAESEFFHQT